MPGTPLRRAIAMLAAAALTATLASSTLAADVDPAAKKPVVKCDGKVATKVGTPGRDVIRGTAKRDVIAGLGGHDIILGGGGNDVICGGPGNDRITGNAGKDKLLGGGGNDRLFGGSGPDRLFGGAANDFLAGQTGPDVLGGGPGSDRLDGGIGVDLCAQNSGIGAMVRCELPRSVFAPPPAAPTPEPDSDGDGVPDASDACPSEGDRGWGVDATGCPNDPVTLTYRSTSVGKFRPTATWSGLEPLTKLTVLWPGIAHWLFNSDTGSGSKESAFELDCPGNYTPAIVTATEAGGSEREYSAPGPDSSVCP